MKMRMGKLRTGREKARKRANKPQKTLRWPEDENILRDKGVKMRLSLVSVEMVLVLRILTMTLALFFSIHF